MALTLHHSEPDFKPTRFVAYVHGPHGVDQDTTDQWEDRDDWLRKKREPVLEVSVMQWSPTFYLFRDAEGHISRIDGFQVDTLRDWDPIDRYILRIRPTEDVVTFTDWCTGQTRSWLLGQAHSPIAGQVAKVVWYEPFTVATGKELVH